MKDTKLYFNGCLWPIGAGGGPLIGWADWMLTEFLCKS